MPLRSSSGDARMLQGAVPMRGRTKSGQLDELQSRFEALKDDFKFNLSLLDERDGELVRADAVFAELKGAADAVQLIALI